MTFLFLYYLILLCSYSLDACLLSNKKQRGCGSRWDWGMEGTGEGENTLYEKYLLSVKKNKRIKKLKIYFHGVCSSSVMWALKIECRSPGLMGHTFVS